MGTFFVIPVYLQVVLGLDAFETGKRLLPLSVAMLVFALLGPRVAARRSPRTVAQIGLVAVSVGALVMLGDARRHAQRPRLQDRARAGRRRRRSARLAARQRDHVRPSRPTKTSEAGGLQGTAQNLGSSLGTAIIGAVLLASLATGFSERIANNPASRRPRARRSPPTPRRASTSCRSTPSSRPRSTAGSPRSRPSAVADDYGDAQLDALRLALGAVALAALLSLWFTRRLPTTSLAASAHGLTVHPDRTMRASRWPGREG